MRGDSRITSKFKRIRKNRKNLLNLNLPLVISRDMWNFESGESKVRKLIRSKTYITNPKDS